MTAKQVRVRLLKVTACQDGLMWYAKLVGEYVPCLGFDHGEWKSRAPSGYSNFIAEHNARVVHVFVNEDKLGEYPYKYARVERLDKPQKVASAAPKAKSSTKRVEWPALPALPALPAQFCKDRCDMLGVCRGLPDCEEALGRARQTKPVQATAGQSHRASAIEAATNIVLGFGISVSITAVLLPAFGHEVTLTQNVAMTSVFTVASFARAYGLRRLFNWLLLRHTTRAGA
jgi:hypothetical protein